MKSDIDILHSVFHELLISKSSPPQYFFGNLIHILNSQKFFLVLCVLRTVGDGFGYIYVLLHE